jgi:H2-forming N5,N10-methylenetetrahydromethanopterin dehydrogenase-like enzyme
MLPKTPSTELPEWSIKEAARRRDELLADPKLGLSHDEVWQRIDEARAGTVHPDQSSLTVRADQFRK